jgi:hypothetical protein
MNKDEIIRAIDALNRIIGNNSNDFGTTEAAGKKLITLINSL